MSHFKDKTSLNTHEHVNIWILQARTVSD